MWYLYESVNILYVRQVQRLVLEGLKMFYNSAMLYNFFDNW